MYLKPKPFKVLGELAHEADLFADAQGGVHGCVAKGQCETKSQVTHTYENQIDRKPIFLVGFVVKPIKHIIVGTTRIRGYLLAHLVQN